MAMKTNEVQAFVRNSVVDSLDIANHGVAGGTGVFYVPVETPENGTVYAKVQITCTRFNSTEKVEAFNLDAALAKVEAEAEAAAAKAAEKAAEREAKKAAKANK